MEPIIATIGESSIYLSGNPITDIVKNAVKNIEAKKRSTENTPDPVLDRVYSIANKLHKILVAAGIPEPAASFALYQTFHESAGFTSPLLTQHNNGTGIKFAKQRGATKGNNNYAWFSALTFWAAALKHELTKGANPAGAESIEEYARRLKRNGYYEDSYDNYMHGLKRARLVLKVIPAEQRAGYNPNTGLMQDPQDLDIPGTVDYNKKDVGEWWKGLKTWEKGGLILLGSIVVIKAVQK